MHIKQVTIHGFKSYKNETACEPFHPGHNVVVGRNGSGKSNFFFAIRFVLSDMSTSLSNQERSQLLHGEGLGMAVMSAYVEITFDNSDHRIPIERDEVTLRRTIGLKKDEYHLDTKHVSKQDVMNLLESSGFSRSNPYYIVQQGKITQMTLMKDSERLNLLKEVAGTKVYDERRKQSIAILEDTTSKKERIEEVLNYIETRLAELEDEKDELKEYQDLDRTKRAVEHNIYEKELQNVRDTLQDLDEQRQAAALRRESTLEETEKDKNVIAALTADLQKLEREREKLTREKGDIEGERTDQLRVRAQLELEVSEAESAIGDEKTATTKAKSELHKVRKEKEQKQAELDDLAPELEAATKETDALVEEYEGYKLQQEELFGKQARTSQFKTVAERNKFLDEEIKSLRALALAKGKQAEHARAAVAKLQNTIKKAEEETEKETTDADDRRSRIAELQSEIVGMRDKMSQIQDARRDAWKDESVIDSRRADLKKEVQDAERQLFATTAKHTTKGIEAMRELQKSGTRGIHGPLYDLVDTANEMFRKPAEIIAGNQLFSIVVDTDDVATECIKYMHDNKIDARLTFLPLNRLRQTPYPLPSGEEVLHLHTKIKCDERLKPAVYHIFGRTLLCKTIEVANAYASQHEVDTITLDGDKVARKGAMTGGYLPDKGSKLEIAATLRSSANKFREIDEKLDKAKALIDKLDSDYTQQMSAKKRRENDRDRLRVTSDECTKLIERNEQLVKTSKQTLAEKEADIVQLEKDKHEAETKVDRLQEEKGTRLDSELGEEERELLQDLTEKLADLQPKVAEASTKKESLRKKYLALTNAITINLEQRERKLTKESESYTYEDQTEKFKSKSAELKRAEKVLKESDTRRRDIDDLLKTKKTEIAEIQRSLDEAKTHEQQRVTSDADADKILDKILGKRAQLLTKQDQLQGQIRDLGAVPKGYEEHTRTSVKNLYKKLSAINKKLKDPKYKQINKKALDQYVSFSEQRDALTGRKDNQDSADASIQTLITVLDNQKDEAIERTFKQVSKYFKEVFSELVPSGEAELVMQKRMDMPDLDDEAGPADDASEEEEEDDEPSDAEDSSDADSPPRKKGSKGKAKAKTKAKAKKFKGKGKGKAKATIPGHEPRIDQYVGISVRVSFTGKETETQLLQQLSGGQKTIVALALIFAIQRCDPAPFYLFDEIDAALDSAHRVAVADMIHKLSDSAQFITTTFRPEMLQKADKFYGVTFQKKVSRIDCVERAEAMEFLEDVTTT